MSNNLLMNFAIINKQDGITTQNDNVIVIHNISYQLPIGIITLCPHFAIGLTYNWYWNNKLFETSQR